MAGELGGGQHTLAPHVHVRGRRDFLDDALELGGGQGRRRPASETLRLLLERCRHLGQLLDETRTLGEEPAPRVEGDCAGAGIIADIKHAQRRPGRGERKESSLHRAADPARVRAHRQLVRRRNRLT